MRLGVDGAVAAPAVTRGESPEKLDVLYSRIKNGSMKRGAQEFLHAQDVVVGLKLVALGATPWTYASLGVSLGLSASQVHTSVRRLGRCDLFSVARKAPLGRNLLEFISHGVRYVFPATVGATARGVPTAASAPPLDKLLASGDERFVWASKAGSAVGQAVDPLIAGVPEMVERDPVLGELLALVDAIRIGKARERAVAVDALKKRLVGVE